MAKTKLIRLLNKEGVYPQNWKTKEEVNQEEIDRVQKGALTQLSWEDISAHNLAAYSNSVANYNSKPVNQLAIPDLLEFMALIPNDGLVLDIAAGHLRDSLYMIDPESRDSLNRDGMISPSAEKRLRVIPFEGSVNFLDSCIGRLEGNMDRVPLVVAGDFMAPGFGEAYRSSDENLSRIFTEDQLEPVLDGIWSCAGYMIHMAPGKLGETTRKWTKALKQGGVLGMSYINRKDGVPGMKLLASRSAPGEVKVFSHYTSTEVDRSFRSAGLKLVDSSKGDYTGHGHVMSDFFGSAIYRKE
jgi:hypothetical protein